MQSDIGEQVHIPFQQRWREPMLQGQKTATSRTKRYGYKGDFFEQWGRFFIITQVRKLPLATIARDYYQQEGCSDPEAFVKVWEEIHPKAGWRPNQAVYYHEFDKLKNHLHFHVREGNPCRICGYDTRYHEVNKDATNQ